MKLIFYTALVFIAASGSADAQDPHESLDANFARVATQQLLHGHLRRSADTERLSEQWAREFLLTLDPLRMHFLATDEEEILAQSRTLIRQANEGKVDFSVLASSRFRLRLEDNTAHILKLIDERHDFSVDESIPTKYAAYPENAVAARERWRLRIKYELLVENAGKIEDAESREFLRGRYKTILNHSQTLTKGKAVALYVNSLAKVLDPHSAYFDETYLTLYRTGPVQNFRLPFPFVYRNGDIWIQSTTDVKTVPPEFRGFRIAAIHRVDGPTIHLTGLTEHTAERTIISPIAELSDCRSVILDLDNPKTGERKIVECDRSPRKR